MPAGPWRGLAIVFALLLGICGARAEDAKLAPLPGGVQLPLPVHFSIRVIDVSRLAETLGEASMSLEITERWRDPGQAFDPKVTGVYRFDLVGTDATTRLARMWAPPTEIENQISEPRSQSVALSVGADGTVTRIRRLDADFRVAIDMRTFPFDRQTLTLSLVTARHAADEMIFVMDDLDRQLSSVSEALSLANWQAGGLRFAMERYPGWNRKPFVRVKATTVVERRWQRYVLPLFVPFIAVLSVSLFILWAPDRLTGEKAPLTYSALLALAALSFTYDSSFPGSISMNSPVAFMVSLGYFYLVTVLLIDILLVHVNFPGKQANPHLAPAIRANIRYTVPLIFALICFCSVMRAMI